MRWYTAVLLIAVAACEDLPSPEIADAIVAARLSGGRNLAASGGGGMLLNGTVATALLARR